MYATVNLPGSTHFDYFGPGSKTECYEWLRYKEYECKISCGGLWFNAYSPDRILSNREAEGWRYRDGTKVITPYSNNDYKEYLPPDFKVWLSENY